MDFKTHHSAMPSRHSSISQLKTEYSIGTGHMANPHLYLRLGKGWFMVALQPADFYQIVSICIINLHLQIECFQASQNPDRLFFCLKVLNKVPDSYKNVIF